MRHANVPPAFVVVQRINLGLFAVLAPLGATANWRRIAEEIWPWVEGPPSTPLGELEHAWRGRSRHADGPFGTIRPRRRACRLPRTMDFDLPPELAELQATVRKLAQEQVAPRAREIDTTEEYPQDLFELFVDTGLLGLVHPRGVRRARAPGSSASRSRSKRSRSTPTPPR